MTINKLSAGSGYDYLTRQVAALDATAKGQLGLASYYIERGESPGVWVGSGLAGADGLDAGDAVTAGRMRAPRGGDASVGSTASRAREARNPRIRRESGGFGERGSQTS
jgi:TrwC relaxase